MEILVYILPFVVLSPILIIGIKKFIDLFGYKKTNLEYTEANLIKTDYASMYSRTRSAPANTAYSYMKVGTYSFEVDGKTYEFTYSTDREHGILPKKITTCYPKGKPHKAYAEGNPPIIKGFFNAFTFIGVYAIAAINIVLICQLFFL